MPAIYAIGETIYDIIFKDGEPVAAKAGGSMLNTTVSLGRLGLDVNFISEMARDQAGNIIAGFLSDNGVKTDNAYRHEGKSIIALAFLQKNNDARYSFYKPVPEKRLQVNIPAFEKGDIVLFGAFYSLMKGVREQLLRIINAAHEYGALILYDPNIRSPHKNEIAELRGMIKENFRLSDIVRASDEDFQTMFDIATGAEAYDMLRKNACHYLVYTKSDVGVEFYYPEGMTEIPVPPVSTKSTIGAGDSFNAGLIYELAKSGERPEMISVEKFQEIIKTAIRFGSHVCTHYENYISEEFARLLSD